MQVEAAGRIVQGATLAGYEAVRFKKAQPALSGGSWTSLQHIQVLLPEGSDTQQAQQAVDRSSAMAKGAIVARSGFLFNPPVAWAGGGGGGGG